MLNSHRDYELLSKMAQLGVPLSLKGLGMCCIENVLDDHEFQ